MFDVEPDFVVYRSVGPSFPPQAVTDRLVRIAPLEAGISVSGERFFRPWGEGMQPKSPVKHDRRFAFQTPYVFAEKHDGLLGKTL